MNLLTYTDRLALLITDPAATLPCCYTQTPPLCPEPASTFVLRLDGHARPWIATIEAPGIGHDVPVPSFCATHGQAVAEARNQKVTPVVSRVPSVSTPSTKYTRRRP